MVPVCSLSLQSENCKVTGFYVHATIFVCYADGKNCDVVVVKSYHSKRYCGVEDIDKCFLSQSGAGRLSISGAVLLHFNTTANKYSLLKIITLYLLM